MSDKLNDSPEPTTWYINPVKMPKNTPSENILIDLNNIVFVDDEVPLFLFDRTIDTPTMNMKNGYTKSVRVIPCQSACSNGAKVLPQLPGLLTMIIKAIVNPLKTSTDIYLSLIIF